MYRSNTASFEEYFILRGRDCYNDNNNNTGNDSKSHGETVTQWMGLNVPLLLFPRNSFRLPSGDRAVCDGFPLISIGESPWNVPFSIAKRLGSYLLSMSYPSSIHPVSPNSPYICCGYTTHTRFPLPDLLELLVPVAAIATCVFKEILPVRGTG